MSTKITALVTGANKGIGLAVARQLGERGFAVWLGCRDHERGESAAAQLRDAGIDARAVILDVADGESVRRAAANIASAVMALDVLVNNAGINLGAPGKVSEESVDGIRALFEVNAFGAVRVTQAFLPLLRKSAAGRIVMMSSGLASIAATRDMTSENWGVPYAGYSASKTALNMFTVKFAKELLADGIKVNAVDPGLTATDLNGHMGDRTVDAAASIAVQLATIGPMGPTGGFFHDGSGTPFAAHAW
ncbi:SDR family oxidoreductase [Lichenicoccus sp.]|uniref:SDR family oxidoreductase n=1 Tax=Lichenicoccus sp. TaxID=2781899 RepID=UPI003D0ABEC9